MFVCYLIGIIFITMIALCVDPAHSYNTGELGMHRSHQIWQILLPRQSKTSCLPQCVRSATGSMWVTLRWRAWRWRHTSTRCCQSTLSVTSACQKRAPRQVTRKPKASISKPFCVCVEVCIYLGWDFLCVIVWGTIATKGTFTIIGNNSSHYGDNGRDALGYSSLRYNIKGNILRFPFYFFLLYYFV